MLDITTEVLENVCLTGKYHRLRIASPQIASETKTGQFCMLRPERSGESLMRRPFSVAAVRDHEILEFAYTAIGRGTRLLASLKPGDSIWCLGPLGNQFPIVEGCRAIVVAGGIGIAPFPLLNSILNEHRIFPITLYGARNASELIYVEELNGLSDRLEIATDDGSAGFHGFVTQLLEKELEKESRTSVIYACGPHPMMKRVKQIAEKFDVPAYLSMEEIMGCGIGICIGCPIPGVTLSGDDIQYLCCKDGPIFPSSLVKL
jgi:dihydroorotate dehydrogenase electron transfer subunit